MYDVVIVGAGTAGLTAAIYTARGGLDVLVLEQGVYGGQIVNALHVFNYPGVKTTSGVDFAMGLQAQAKAFGADFAFEQATGISEKGSHKVVHTPKRDIDCRAVILATGATNRPLGLPNEQQLIGRGISYCATCDGAMFRDKVVAVVGGGTTAAEDALFLSAYCKKITLIHRRREFRAEERLITVLRGKANVEFVLDSGITGLAGEETLTGIHIENIITGEKGHIEIDGLFVAIGQMPQNGAFSPPVTLDDYGYILANEDCTTGVDGIFAAGDCRVKTVRQLVTAAADGAVAAVTATSYLHR